MNKVFKTKFDPATGLSYAVSELSRNMLKTVTVVAIGGLALSTTAQAAECTLSGATYTINGKTCDLPDGQLAGTRLHITKTVIFPAMNWNYLVSNKKRGNLISSFLKT